MAFLAGFFRRWLLVVVGAPIVGWLLTRVGRAVERRRGSSRSARALQRGGEGLKSLPRSRRRRRHRRR